MDCEAYIALGHVLSAAKYCYWVRETNTQTTDEPDEHFGYKGLCYFYEGMLSLADNKHSSHLHIDISAEKYYMEVKKIFLEKYPNMKDELEKRIIDLAYDHIESRGLKFCIKM